jgi:CheY-like chemotaxis protein
MSRTILLADDSLTIQKVVELTFADTEYQVVALSSGDELLDRMRDLRPDVVICDVIMPGKDGYEVCQQIKSDPNSLHIPVVLLSGTFEPFDRDKALAAGCSEIITKPFEARKLIDTVDRLLEEGPGEESTQLGSESNSGDVFEDSPIASVEGREEFDFGTRLSPPEPAHEEPPYDETPEAGVEALDFTDTGFEEMTAAGDAALEPTESIPHEGIDIEMMAGSQAEAFTASEEPRSDSIFEEAESGDEPGPFFDPSEEPGEPVSLDRNEDDPFDGTAPTLEEAIGLGAAQTEAAVEDPFKDAARMAEDFVFANAAASEPEIEAEQDEVSSEDWESESDIQPPEDEATSELPLGEAPGQPDHEVGTDAEDEIEAVPESSASSGLSDEDVDRIARRVIELASEQIEHIAWEVIPDMAEIVVRERIRQLEDEVDGGE